MAELDRALTRLDAATAALQAALEIAASARRNAAEAAAAAATADGGGEADPAALAAAFAEERAQLLARIATLEAQAEEDARLRLEAAEAVKAALSDLRAVSGEGNLHLGEAGHHG
ncbi:MAG: hypothetical protein AAFV49_08060 [Pseudomonadota bacterium]